MKVLVTGGTGYIGSHTLVDLLQQGHQAVVVDNLSNSDATVLGRVQAITGKAVPFIEADLRDSAAMAGLFRQHPDIGAVIHFAGLKAVGESVAKPLLYYDNNITGTLTLLKAMQAAGCQTLIFSSSATVYRESQQLPLTENHPLGTTNPYGASKLMIEDILRDMHAADPAWRIALLRYFNPVGAHPSGLIGENPRGTPNNLMPYVAQVAAGLRPRLQVFGGDYPTKDGTGVRDYIHVVDLARGHLAALDALARQAALLTVNLGTGTGYSVLEMVAAFEKACGRPVPFEIVSRRPGDLAECYADPSLAGKLLGWKAELGLEAMCADVWRWQQCQAR